MRVNEIISCKKRLTTNMRVSVYKHQKNLDSIRQIYCAILGIANDYYV